MTEIIFEVTEGEVDGGYSARALGHSIYTKGESLEEFRHNVKDPADCHFDESMDRPNLDPLPLCAGRGSLGMNMPDDLRCSIRRVSLRCLSYGLVDTGVRNVRSSYGCKFDL